jgi:HAD superfamily hydrolase (TIGR01509 family)
MEAVILDMDGVLVDSEPLHLAAANKVLARFDVELSDEENNQYLGLDDPSFFAALKKRFGLDEEVESLAAAREAEVLELIGKGVVPKEGVPELVAGLKMRGYAMALASSSPRPVVEAMLRELGLDRVFDAVVTGDDVEDGKPAPDIFLRAAQELGVKPEQCLVIEDALHGVRAARAAGMLPLAVRTRENFGVEFSEAERVYDGLDRFDWAFLDDR